MFMYIITNSLMWKQHFNIVVGWNENNFDYFLCFGVVY